MTSTTTVRYEIGSREWKIANLARDMRYHADKVDALGERVIEWAAAGHSPTDALGMIEQGEKLATEATRIHAAMEEVGVGRSTRSSYLNESCSVGGTNGASARGRGAIAYAVLYALATIEKYGPETGLANMETKRAGLRVHASNCRVIAGMLDDLASGKLWGIR